MDTLISVREAEESDAGFNNPGIALEPWPYSKVAPQCLHSQTWSGTCGATAFEGY